MRNRTLALLLGLGLVFGAAACGDDDDSGDDDSTEQDSGGSGDSGDSGGSESGNAEVEAYCDAVAEYVEAAQEVIDNPGSADAS